jgi:hypothetical protein
LRLRFELSQQLDMGWRQRHFPFLSLTPQEFAVSSLLSLSIGGEMGIVEVAGRLVDLFDVVSQGQANKHVLGPLRNDDAIVRRDDKCETEPVALIR